jgi:hypothetical protein
METSGKTYYSDSYGTADRDPGFGLLVSRPPLGIYWERKSIMTMDSRIESLKERHAALEMQIAEEDSRPRPDTDMLFRLKLEKLRIKEELERLLGSL